MLFPVPYDLPDNRPLCFIHIPKTAGTSLNTLLEQVYSRDEICSSHYQAEIAAIPSEQRNRYQYIGAHMGYGIANLLEREPVFITLLRDPVDRVLSHYYFVRDNPRSVFHHQLSLEDFLANPAFDWVTRNLQTRFLGTDKPIAFVIPASGSPKPDTYVYPTLTEATLRVAQKRLSEMAFVGLQSHFDDSLHMLAYRLGWPPVTHVPRKNTTARRKAKEDVSGHLLERIRRMNSLDIALYDHAQQLFDRQRRQIMSAGMHSLAELADHHYRDVFKAQFPPRSACEHDMRYCLPESGWYPAENHPEHGAYRWMGREAFVDLPISAEAARQVQLTMFGTIQQDVLPGFRLHVNGQPVVLVSEAGAGHTSLYRGTIPADVLARHYPVRLTFSAEKTHSPKALGLGQRDRQISVAIASIRID